MQNRNSDSQKGSVWRLNLNPAFLTWSRSRNLQRLEGRQKWFLPLIYFVSGK